MTMKREPVDMSAKAIASRLAAVGQLHKLMLSFRTIRMDHAKPVNPPSVKPPAGER